MGRLFFALVALALVGFLGLAVASWLLFDPISVVPGTWLELSFAPDYPEERPARLGLAALGADPISAQETQEALRRAAVDDRVAGVLLRPDGYEGGWAQLQELMAGLEKLRAGGKAVWAYVETPRAASYCLATVAESIAMAPEGTVQLLGLEARLLFLQGTLEKLGIAADFVTVGRYKSAPEQLTQREASAPSREQVGEFLDDVYQAWIDLMCQRRGLTTQRMVSLIDRGLFDPGDALAEGLVDLILDETQLHGRLGGGDEGLPLLDVREYLAAAGEAPHSRLATLALIYATGTIASGVSDEGGWDGAVLGSDTLIERLRSARQDEDVQAVVLRVDSPGGSALASDLIYREILRVQESKPVVVSVGNLAASGGYYVAMPAERIVADPVSLVGSIGVYAGKMDMRGFYEKLGLSFETMQRGENADLFSDLRPFSSTQRVRLQTHLDEFYARFVDKVAQGRMLDIDKVEAAAQGRVWSGRRALEMGLVDQLGTLDDAIAAAKDLVGLDASTPVRLRTYQPRPSLLQRAMHQLLGELIYAAQPGPWVRWQKEIEHQARLAVTMDGSPQYHVPWRLSIQ